MVLFANEPFLMKAFAHKKFAHQEQILNVDHIAQRSSQLFRFVIVQVFDCFALFFGTVLAQRVFDL